MDAEKMPAATITGENQWTTPIACTTKREIELSVRRISGTGTKVRARKWFFGQSSADAVYSEPIERETDIIETAGNVLISLGVKTGEFTNGESLVVVLGGV